VPFLDELKRRNVGRVAVAYAIVAWMIVEVMSVFAPALKMPEWVMSLVALVAIIGFPIALVLSWVYELTPAGLRRTDEVPAGQSIARVTAQKLNYLIIGALAVALVFVVVDAYVLPEGTTAIAPAASAPAPSPATGAAAQGTRAVLANSVAVLPFANLSPNADDAYFAQGIHDEVLNQLAKLDALSVIARTSVLRYADGKTSLPDIARELNVQTVMEGSVRYAGDSVRITAQLIDPKTGTQLWSEAYQRKFEDIFTIQADIAMNIANALRAEFSLEEQREIERPLTTSPEAYALYLQSSTSELALDAARALLDRAIELDPSFAPAYGRRAVVYSRMLTNTVLRNAVRSEDRTEVERLLRESAQRALALDPKEFQGQAALDAIDVQRWYWSVLRVPSAQQLPVLTPAAAWVHAWKGNLAAILSVSERWAEIDPNVLGPYLNLGVLYAYAGDREASNRALRRALEFGPGFNLALAFIAYNAVAAGNTEAAFEALAQLQRALGDNPPVVFLPEMAYAYGRLGRRDEAQRLFALIEAAANERDIGTGGWALAYLAIGDEKTALEKLEAAAVKVRNHESDPGYLSLMNLKMNFLADPLVATPRFAEVLARIHGD
jgi:TolB-like protein/Tfp pilus assembly protein PilF